MLPPALPLPEPRPFAELRDTGLLWLINRTVFHPCGLALALHTDHCGNPTGWNLVRSPDGHPWVFDLDTDADGHARAEATIAATLTPDTPDARPDKAADNGHAQGGIVRTRPVGEDSPPDDSGGVRVEYQARVPRRHLGAAIAEALDAIARETQPPGPAPAQASPDLPRKDPRR